MVDPRKTEAVRLYLGNDASSYPRADADAVLNAYPEDGSELLAYARTIVAELNAVTVDWSTETYRQSIERVKNEMAGRHPELGTDAIAALGWSFSYDWK